MQFRTYITRHNSKTVQNGAALLWLQGPQLLCSVGLAEVASYFRNLINLLSNRELKQVRATNACKLVTTTLLEQYLLRWQSFNLSEGTFSIENLTSLAIL